LVSCASRTRDLTRVTDADGDLYGKEYWFSHQTKDFGYPSIIERARMDLVERCPYWLRTVLQFRLPPARVLELGSGPGGLLALLSWAGFDAIGLELSPWVVERVAESFGVDVRRGPVEDQDFASESFSVIAMMDVLEHLPDPVATVGRCMELLRPDGVLIVQTPRYPRGTTHQELVEGGSPFLQHLQHEEHLFLFNEASVEALMRKLGATEVAFEPAVYPHYDMYLTAAKSRLVRQTPEAVDTALAATPSGRLVRALLDAVDQVHSFEVVRARLQSEVVLLGQAASEREQLLVEADGELKKLHARVAELESQRETFETAARERLEVLVRAGAELDLAVAAREQVGERIRILERTAAVRQAALDESEASRRALAAEIERLRLDLAAVGPERLR
jgi:2-polyprenyl-3-methyl-5-hydroxy-6-metoxy-1,4-benzoquinol methylase/cell division protein FtsB